ncbi:MAG TPA: hydroxymethylbilane synthase [Acidimicrobiales bacterium]|nr:hydroxymethylbilane synthase [Acidimicrobiales bacterium]
MRLRIATRGSALALWQARHVAALLREAARVDATGPAEIEEVIVRTTGDVRRDVPIHEMGGQGVFVKEVQAAVLEGRADLAVHSAKDLPPRPAPGLVLAAVPRRADPRDALAGAALADLPAGARVATGSVRRRAQLAWLRPDLTFVGLRGNIGTRLERVGAAGADRVDAVVVAAAALDRLGLLDRAAEVLPVSALLPQVGQGALAVECADDRPDVRELVARIEDLGSRREVDAERAFLDTLGGGCELPVGALARAPSAGGALTIDVMMASLDGRVVARHRAEGPAAEPEVLGRAAAAGLPPWSTANP